MHQDMTFRLDSAGHPVGLRGERLFGHQMYDAGGGIAWTPWQPLSGKLEFGELNLNHMNYCPYYLEDYAEYSGPYGPYRNY